MIIHSPNRIYNLGHNILRLFDVLSNFLSPQVKRIVFISNKHGIYELPQELQNDLRLKTRKLGNISKIKELYPSAQSSSQNENFVNTSKKLLKN